MIPCFEATSRISSGLCNACGRACSAAPDCVEACCQPALNVCNRPLGCYVVAALVTNLPAAVLAYQSSTYSQVRYCKSAPVLNFCDGAIVLSLTNIAFAFYMQWRLVAALRSGDEGGARTMLQQASGIVLYDFVFCIYVFLFAAGIIYCFFGIRWWQSCDVDSWNPFWAAFLILLFGLWSGIFSCCWGLSLGCWGVLESLGVSSSVARLVFGAADGVGCAGQSGAKADVIALYARFRRLAPSGYLLQQQFQQTMGVMGLTDDHFLVDRMFQVFDTDHDGKLSFIEFASALAIMIRGTEDEKLAFSFKIVGGKEASGVRLEDFQQLVASYNRMMSSLVAPTGRLTSDEDVKRLFHELASTRDETEEEVISLDAYKAAAQENGDFLSCLGLEQPLAMFPPAEPVKPPSFRKRTHSVEDESGSANCFVSLTQWTEAGEETLEDLEDGDEEDAEQEYVDHGNEYSGSSWKAEQTSEDDSSGTWNWSEHWNQESQNREEQRPEKKRRRSWSVHEEDTTTTHWSNWRKEQQQEQEQSWRRDDKSEWHGQDNEPGNSRAHGQETSEFWSPEGYQLIYISKVQAKLMLTMPGFTSYHISRVIGKKGSVLRDMGLTTGTKVFLCGRESNRPTDEDNHLLVTGRTSADLERGLLKACATVAEVLNTEFPICTHCGGDHKSRDCQKMRLPFVHDIYLEQCTNVGFIIGAQGRNVQPIVDATGANIRMLGVGSGEYKAIEPLHMRIEAATQHLLDQAVAMAEDLIRRVTHWSPYDKDPPPGKVFEYQHKIWLDMEADRQGYDSLNAHLLGKGGQNFRQIHERTGAWLWLRGHGAGHTSCLDPIAKKEGLHLLIEHDDKERAHQAVEMATGLLDTVLARLGSTYCNICGGPHFTYRCLKANSTGYLNEMAAKGAKGSGKARHRSVS
ncbi:ncsA [Symbiodinium sp. KB8]|nr:ncsA [Symbiodinium sp. KB8]